MSVLGVLTVVVLLGAVLAVGASDSDELLAQLQAAIIPEEGTETAYDMVLSLEMLPQLIEWWSTLVPTVESDSRYYDALSGLVAPCCDDNTAFRCCCEDGGQSCNIIRSGKGLASYLIHEHDYTVEQIQESVLEWFRFARADYYLAAALDEQGVRPGKYDLTTKGSCYRFMCNTPISEGGCGGMEELIEPAIETTDT